MKKDEMVIEFTDGTKGLLSMETIKGRVDVKAEYVDVRVYYYTEHVNNQWVVKRCTGGFCYDFVIIAEKATRKEAIAEIILDVRKNQVRTANTYILETSTGRMFEVVATSEHLAKKCVRFKCGVSEQNLITKEIKKADETKQQKARIGEYADFINELLPTPSDEPKTEEEEEAAEEHFVKQMSESAPEYMGVEYMDSRRLNNWKKLLLEKLYDGKTEHDKIYCNTNYGKIFGWFWNKKGSEQFKRLYGGDMQEVASDIYFIDEMHDMFLEIICGVETDEISIESQLIEKGYLQKVENKPEYIFDTLQSYTYLFELTELLLELKMKSYVKEIEKYLVLSNRELLYKIKDPEKTILAFCKDMKYLTERIIADYFKGVENNDNC